MENQKSAFFDTNKFVAATTAIPNIGSGPEEFFEVSGETDEQFYDLFGSGKNAKIKAQGKAEKRASVGHAKELEAQAKIEAAHSAQATGIAAAKSATEQAKATVTAAQLAAQNAMPLGVKIGLAVGAMAVVITGIFLLTKKKKKVV